VPRGKERQGARRQGKGRCKGGKAWQGTKRQGMARKGKVLGGKAREGARRQGKVCRHEETSRKFGNGHTSQCQARRQDNHRIRSKVGHNLTFLGRPGQGKVSGRKAQ
jgi:hypothetical protein